MINYFLKQSITEFTIIMRTAWRRGILLSSVRERMLELSGYEPAEIDLVKIWCRKGYVYGLFTYWWLPEEMTQRLRYEPILYAIKAAAKLLKRKDVEIKAISDGSHLKPLPQCSFSDKQVAITIRWKPRKNLEDVTIGEGIRRLCEEYKLLMEKSKELLNELHGIFDKEGIDKDKVDDTILLAGTADPEVMSEEEIQLIDRYWTTVRNYFKKYGIRIGDWK